MKSGAGYTPAVHTAERETQRGSGNSISRLQGPFELKGPPPGPQSRPEDSDAGLLSLDRSVLRVTLTEDLHKQWLHLLQGSTWGNFGPEKFTFVIFSGCQMLVEQKIALTLI